MPPIFLPTPPPGVPAGLPPGAGPQAGGALGVAAGPGMAAVPMMPMMPPMMEPASKLNPTGQTHKLLGYACPQFELDPRGQRLEIWAAERLLPFPGYLRHQPHRLGPRMIVEQGPELLRAKKPFPLRVSLEGRAFFGVTAVQPVGIKDQSLFLPPADYRGLEPWPF